MSRKRWDNKEENMAARKEQFRFPSPYEVPPPEGAEGWEEMYPAHFLFTEDTKEIDDSRVWLRISSVLPFVMYPIDCSFGAGVGTANSYGIALLAIPTTWGWVGRYLNGYAYVSSSEITDPKVIEERAQIFGQRVRFIIDNWDELWHNWVEKQLKVAEELEKIRWPELKLIEDLETAGWQGRMWDEETAPSGAGLLQNFNRLKNLMYEATFMHAEPYHLALTCYMVYRDFCLKAFPGMEERIIATTLSGVEQPIMEGDFHLRELAGLAVKLGIQDIIKQKLEPEGILRKLVETDAGKKWLEKWEESKFWFHQTTGNGLYHYHVSWLDDLSIPFELLRNYISALERGERITVDREERAREAVRLFEKYRELLPTEDDKQAFTELWLGARRTAVAIEGHALYSDQRLFPIGYRKLKELGQYLHRYGIFKDPSDIRFLQFYEVEETLNDLVNYWYTHSEPLVRPLQEKIEKRKRIIKVLESYDPPSFLVGKKAKMPERITDPMVAGVWGLTREKIEEMITPPGKVTEIKGWAASPGVCEGVVKVVKDLIAELDKIEVGDIVVTSLLYPAHAGVFAKAKGLVTDDGGIMSHPAIIAREYGIPAVVGTRIGTNTLKDGMMVRLDGTNGSVTILE
jgi:pyruvate,water dikinase